MAVDGEAPREIMWAPWRMAYIERDHGREPAARAGCVFCDLPARGDDRAALILARGEHCYTVMNRYPYNNGHLMIVPYAHIDALTRTTPEAASEMMELARTAQEVLSRLMRPHGFNLGMNQGAAAGAGIAEHLHLHLVPRWSGDTNFMPVMTDTRVMPQHLDASYDLLIEGFAR